MVDDVIIWRRAFHEHPELEFAVEWTASTVSEILSSFGIKVYNSIGGTGLVGELSAGNMQKAIGLRADMDALPIQEKNQLSYRSKADGVMHACGHDGHMAMLLGAAKKLSETKNFNGTVYFVFQPNEERGLGAQAMIDDGLFERFNMQAIYGLHNMPGIPQGEIHVKSGAIMAAEDNFRIIIKGQGGHSSQPHQCIDPIVVGAHIVTALQTITSRSLDPFETAVISITDFKTDGNTNVIASNVEISGDCRSFNESVQEVIEMQMHQIVKATCECFGAGYEFSYQKLFYPTINSEEETQAVINAAIAVNGEGGVDANCKAVSASEDFSSMLRVKPGAYALIGNGVDSKGGCVLHNPEYDFNDEIIETGINYWVELVEQQLR